MKKIYNQPELEIVVMEEELISTASTAVVNAEYFGDDVNCDNWYS